MIICHSRKFIFVHIHKTGGTSVERALDPHLAWNDLILGGSKFGEKIQQPYATRFGLSKHSTVADIERICGRDVLDSYYVFALVRHPLFRMCSLYNFVATTLQRWAREQGVDFQEIEKFITPEAARKKPVLRWSSTKAFLRSQNFSEFIRHGGLRQAPGFRPQTSCLVGLGDDPFKAEPLRIEDSSAWRGQLCRKLGIQFELGLHNESQLRLVDQAAVGEADRAYIEDIFSTDYAEFGYRS